MYVSGVQEPIFTTPAANAPKISYYIQIKSSFNGALTTIRTIIQKKTWLYTNATRHKTSEGLLPMLSKLKAYCHDITRYNTFDANT